MTTERRALVLVVEGMGSDPTKSGGIAWYFGAAGITDSTYEWLGGTGSGEGLVNPPFSSGSNVDPWTCDVSDSGHNFALHGSTTAKQQWLTLPEGPADELVGGLNSEKTLINFAGDYAWSASNEGEVVWIEEEAIRLGTYNAPNSFFGCTRGYYSSEAQIHSTTALVFRSNPYHVNRVARLYRYNLDNEVMTQIWQGMITRVRQSGPGMEVEANGILSMLQGAKMGRQAKNLQPWSAIFVRDGRARGNVQLQNATARERRVNKRNATSTHWVALQVGEAEEGGLYYAEWDTLRADRAYLSDSDDGATLTSGSDPALGSNPPDRLNAGGGVQVREVLAVDRVKDTSRTTGIAVDYADMRSSTRDLQKPFHPVAISMALLTSGLSPDPGEPGSGAVGEAVAAQGNTGTLSFGGLQGSFSTS